MKTKKFRKKLALNKKTIADLGSKKMSGLKGGKILPSEKTCVTCVYTCVECPTHYLETCHTWACGYSCPCGTVQEDDPMI